MSVESVNTVERLGLEILCPFPPSAARSPPEILVADSILSPVPITGRVQSSACRQAPEPVTDSGSHEYRSGSRAITGSRP